jgi:hypothetical protein
MVSSRVQSSSASASISCDSPDRPRDEAQPGVGQREAAADHGDDSYAVGDERRRVVEQALCLDEC